MKKNILSLLIACCILHAEPTNDDIIKHGNDLFNATQQKGLDSLTLFNDTHATIKLIITGSDKEIILDPGAKYTLATRVTLPKTATDQQRSAAKTNSINITSSEGKTALLMYPQRVYIAGKNYTTNYVTTSLTISRTLKP